MADLFDFKVGGLGFHITAHMIAIAALFVACFAITGYISFRDDTIGSEPLKVLDDLTMDGVLDGGKRNVVAVTTSDTTRDITERSGTVFYLTQSGTAQMNFVLPAPSLGLEYEFILSGADTNCVVAIYPNGYTETGGLPATVLANTMEIIRTDDDGNNEVVASAVGNATADGAGGIEFIAGALSGDRVKFTCVHTGTVATSTPHWMGRAITSVSGGIAAST